MNITKNQIDDLNATIKIELGKRRLRRPRRESIERLSEESSSKRLPSRKNSDGNCEKMYGKSFIGR